MTLQSKKVFVSIATVAIGSLFLTGCGSISGKAIQNGESTTGSEHHLSLPDPANKEQGNDFKERNPPQRKDVERFRDCLQAKGIPASIGPDGQIVYEFTGKQGSLSVTSNDTNDDESKAACLLEVPEYHEPDYNSR